MYKTLELLDLERTLAKPLFEGKTYPWEALGEIKDFILSLGEKLPVDEYEKRGEDVWIAKDAKVFPSAYIAGPAIIGHGTEVRHCAFIRGSALIGDNCVIGNSVEVKNAVIFDNVQVPHYNYVGDSVLGYRSHMGAGSVTSNVKGDRSLVVVKNGDELTIALVGRLDTTTSPQLEGELRGGLDGVASLVFDLEKLDSRTTAAR